jgi:hypothetical protein
LILFGASVFGSRRSLPEGFQNEHSACRPGQRIRAFLSRILDGLSERKKGAKWRSWSLGS